VGDLLLCVIRFMIKSNKGLSQICIVSFSCSFSALKLYVKGLPWF
jgi:hypothetical protein